MVAAAPVVAPTCSTTTAGTTGAVAPATPAPQTPAEILSDTDDDTEGAVTDLYHLRRFLRDWQSRQHGYIVVSAAPPTQKPGTLEVRSAGNLIGWITAVHQHAGVVKITLEVSGSGELKFAGWQNTRRRILWAAEGNCVDDDVWDGRLLDVMRSGAAWVSQRNLSAGFDEGLVRLSKNETTESDVTVGLCISSMNRLWQLRRALPMNILHAWPHRKWTKIHVVVCTTNDETLRFILEFCRFAIEEGLLKVYTTDDRMPYWHASVAKNAAHVVSREDILVNVDGDNLIGRNFPQDVANYFLKGYDVLQYEDGEGTCGRIACLRHYFEYIGGYDEDSYPMGGQDVDLVLRLKALPGVTYKKVKGGQNSQAIPNTPEQKVQCCAPKYEVFKWTRMNTANCCLFRERREVGQVRRFNTGEYGGVFVRIPRLPPDRNTLGEEMLPKQERVAFKKRALAESLVKKHQKKVTAATELLAIGDHDADSWTDTDAQWQTWRTGRNCQQQQSQSSRVDLENWQQQWRGEERKEPRIESGGHAALAIVPVGTIAAPREEANKWSSDGWSWQNSDWAPQPSDWYWQNGESRSGDDAVHVKPSQCRQGRQYCQYGDEWSVARDRPASSWGSWDWSSNRGDDKWRDREANDKWQLGSNNNSWWDSAP